MLLGASGHHIEDVRGGAEGGAARWVQGEWFFLLLFYFFSWRGGSRESVGDEKLKTKKNSLFFSFFQPISTNIIRSPSTSAMTARTPRSAAGAWRPGEASSTSPGGRAPRVR